jgi:hypothetical protein
MSKTLNNRQHAVLELIIAALSHMTQHPPDPNALHANIKALHQQIIKEFGVDYVIKCHNDAIDAVELAAASKVRS